MKPEIHPNSKNPFMGKTRWRDFRIVSELLGEPLRELLENSRFVLDLGCGDGKFVEQCTTLYPQTTVLGIDGFPVRNVARSGYQIECMFKGIALPSNFVDLAISTYAFLFYGFKEINEEKNMELSELFRILKPGGTALILCKVFFTTMDGDNYYHFTLKAIEDNTEYTVYVSEIFLQRLGFNVEIISRRGLMLSLLKLTKLPNIP